MSDINRCIRSFPPGRFVAPIEDTVPPARTELCARRTESGSPTGSMATSTPRPPPRGGGRRKSGRVQQHVLVGELTRNRRQVDAFIRHAQILGPGAVNHVGDEYALADRVLAMAPVPRRANP